MKRSVIAFLTLVLATPLFADETQLGLDVFNISANGEAARIVNAGGIVAYYPSRFPLHHRAEFLNGRDLFGELTKAAHDDGIFVMARMDSNRAA